MGCVALVRCVFGVTVWFGWGGVVSLCRLKLCFSLHKDTTGYFKHGMHSPFYYLRNAVCFIILTYLVPVLFTFYIQGVLKLKKIIPAPKG